MTLAALQLVVALCLTHGKSAYTVDRIQSKCQKFFVDCHSDIGDLTKCMKLRHKMPVYKEKKSN